MSAFELYLLLKLDAVGGLLAVTAILVPTGLALWCLLAGPPDKDDKDWVLFTRHMPKLTAAFIVCALLAVLIPTTKQAATIWLLPKVVNNEQVQRIAGNTLDRLEELTAQQLGEVVGVEK